MKEYIKKPIKVEVVRWTGYNVKTINEFIGTEDINLWVDAKKKKVFINTLEGLMKANIGDYIIKGINGEFYPCKEEIFLKTYEVTNEN